MQIGRMGSSVLRRTALAVISVGLILVVFGCTFPSLLTITLNDRDINSISRICANASTPDMCFDQTDTHDWVVKMVTVGVFGSLLGIGVYVAIRKDVKIFRRLSVVLAFTTTLFVIIAGSTSYHRFQTTVIVSKPNLGLSVLLLQVGGICYISAGFLFLSDELMSGTKSEDKDSKTLFVT